MVMILGRKGGSSFSLREKVPEGRMRGNGAHDG